MNKVILIGNLGSEPEIKQTPNGTQIANVSLATSSSWKDKSTGEKKEKTEWHRLVAFGLKADLFATYCHKGMKLGIEGELQTRSWEDGDGKKRYMTEVLVRDVHFVEKRQEAEAVAYDANAPISSVNAQPPAMNDNSDLPF